MKHVVIVTPYFAPAWSYGGPPRVLFTLAKTLVKFGLEVSVITTDSLGSTRSKIFAEKIDGIKIHRFATPSNTLAYSFKLFYVPNLRKKTEHIVRKADVVLFGDTRSLLSWQMYPDLLLRKIPYGIFPFGQIRLDQSLRSLVKKVFDVLWVQSFFQSARWIFGQTSHEVSDVIQQFGVKKNSCYLLPLTIERKKITPQKFTLQQYGIAPTDKVLLFVGRFHTLKGIDLLLSSVIPLIQSNTHLHLLMIGRDDGYLRQMKQRIPKSLFDHIHILGPLYGNELHQIYSASHCFVYTPTYYEETSTASLEALNFGCPVVTTKYADIPYLEEYKAGYVVPSEVKDIQVAIAKILSHTRQNNQQRLIEDHFSADMIGRKLIQYLEDKKT